MLWHTSSSSHCKTSIQLSPILNWCFQCIHSVSPYVSGSTESLGTASRRSSQAVTEQELVEVLSEHAQKIAETVLSRPETGEDLAKDAQVRII